MREGADGQTHSHRFTRSRLDKAGLRESFQSLDWFGAGVKVRRRCCNIDLNDLTTRPVAGICDFNAHFEVVLFQRSRESRPGGGECGVGKTISESCGGPGPSFVRMLCTRPLGVGSLTIHCLWLALKIMPSVTETPSLRVLQRLVLALGDAWEVTDRSHILELHREAVRKSTTRVNSTENDIGNA